MKTRLLLICLSLWLAAIPCVRAQTPDEAVSSLRSEEELDQLLGPIALYPDALIALILPASTVPSDVVMAARYLRSNGDLDRVDNEPWDDSVKSLSHYPEVMKWMDENLAWTRQLGEAFAAQPADVMNAVQRLRAAARAAGTLVDTPQQTVVVEEGNITIVPADPEVIYVPRYDPEVVYVPRPRYYHDPFITFGVGFSTGVWLGCYDFDWGRHRLWTIDRRDRERYWREHHERRDWHGSPRVVPGPSHPRIVEDNRFRREEWHPRHDGHRPNHFSGGVVRADSDRNDSFHHRSSDQPRSDGRRNDSDNRNDDRRPHRSPDTTVDGNRRPGPNNAAPAAVNSVGVPTAQPSRTGPVPAPAVTTHAASPQPTPPRNVPPKDADRHDHRDREARIQDRPPTPQNPQGRVMQLQTPVQPKQQNNTPTVVNREARAPQTFPQPQIARQHAAPPQQPVQARPQPPTGNASPRVVQSPPSDGNRGGDRRERDGRRNDPP